MSHMKMIAAPVAALMIAAAPVATLPAMAQEAPAQEAVSESELDAFAVAYKEVIAIEQAYGAQLQDAVDENERQTIINEAQAEMTEAVEAAPDIGVDRYIEILQLAQADPDLQARLTSKLQN